MPGYAQPDMSSLGALLGPWSDCHFWMHQQHQLTVSLLTKICSEVNGAKSRGLRGPEYQLFWPVRGADKISSWMECILRPFGTELGTCRIRLNTRAYTLV